ncbi:hypothetical protein DU74_02215 [Methanosarcina mazei]|uniref:4Fe-4S ferredoxin-type domain-containing protein n=1 Tax=Methanosarcina mazei TaxID=2209 RepID=A0A0F8RXQ1_METMZ|nr:Coenzyme F420 hydrogenase/dehydrogenase, beta subunit C-terminal domain [Methanosarcina mazei]KKH59371.1 hypothetical protein DU74_02215 [Methanosarcina mazei]
MKNTINSIVSEELCAGCGTCIAFCPKEAIKLEINNKKGIYAPRINENNCNKCGICYKVCPGYEVNFKELNNEIFGKAPDNTSIGNNLNCYIGYSKDNNIRYNSTSGGVITQLLIFALEEGIIDGALVTKMKKDSPLEPEPFIARTKQEIIDASKSKYCPVPANIALKEILNSKNDEKFAVVGLSCHIHGIRKAERINKKLKQKIVLHIGIVCNQTPTFLATEYILKKLKISSEDVKKLSYRGDGWPGSMKISVNNYEIKQSLGEYWSSGFGQFFYPIRCTICCDHTAELADISFADAWIPEIQKKDNVGTSIIISRNNFSEELIKNATLKNKITLKLIDSSKVVKSQKHGINFKKRDLKGRMALLNVFGKKTPYYDTTGLSNPTMKSCLSGILIYTRVYISSKKNIWGLLIYYQSLRNKLINHLRILIS